MAQFTLAWQGQSVRIDCSGEVADDIGKLFGELITKNRATTSIVSIVPHVDRFSLRDSAGETVDDLTRGDLASFLMDAVIRALITEQKRGVVLHAGAVARNGQAVLVAGNSGSGKSSLICWLVENGFEYLTDEIALLEPADTSVVGLPRALVIKPGSAEHIRKMSAFRDASTVAGGTHIMIKPPHAGTANKALPVVFVIFPDFALGDGLSFSGLSAAECGLRLVQCNLNARNFRDGGFGAITRLARKAPALRLHYGSYDQLEGRLDTLLALAMDGTLDGERLRRLLTGLGQIGRTVPVSASEPRKPRQIPAPTPLRAEKKALTIGMATYDDYDGVYFTLQALRAYHGDALADTEILVIDNHPTGPCARALKSFEGASADYRYVPTSERTGTMVRQKIADEGRGEFILVMDCHVLLWPGALAKLRRYIADNSQSRDLLQGPLVYDDLRRLASHFRPEWREGMYGVWDLDSRANDLDGPPFEIPMQGLGLYAFRRAAWPGFNPAFRGFGGEEWYIHEKFRQNGGRALCLPFLRWLHRFQRPMGLPYANRWEDRIRNYLIGFRELGQSTQPVEAHFIEFLGKHAAGPLLDAVHCDLNAYEPVSGSGTAKAVSINAPSLTSSDRASRVSTATSASESGKTPRSSSTIV